MYNDDGTWTDEGGPQTPVSNWWEGPRPANWPAQAPWPPPLPPGTHYGSAPGSIVYAEPSEIPAPGAPYNPANPTPPGSPYPVATPPPGPGPGPGPGGGGGGGGTSLIGAPGAYVPGAYPGVPEFHPPTYTPPPAFTFEDFTAPEAFHGPTAASVLSDPSYTFRRDQGQQALEQSAAARGVLNGGGTLADILKYGQNFASTEYSNIWNRDLGAYDTNTKNAFDTYNTRYKSAADTYATNLDSQYKTPYDYAYRSAMDQFAPQMQQYQNRFSATQRDAEFGWEAQYRRWVEDFNHRFQVANAQ